MVQGLKIKLLGLSGLMSVNLREMGLGVKDLCLLNLSLLGKWRWRLLEEDGSLWKRVLVTKYRGNAVGNSDPVASSTLSLHPLGGKIFVILGCHGFGSGLVL